jgi:hypothetical protein
VRTAHGSATGRLFKPLTVAAPAAC